MKLLLITTRALCYFSAGFFLDRIAEGLENLGHEVLRLDFEDDAGDYDDLEALANSGFDAILDINSRLPYVQLEEGGFLLDAFGVPFFNYILDHPLYHHPGLCFPLKNYHAIGIDRFHCSFMEKYYPHLKSVSFLPLAGTESVNKRPFKEKNDGIFFGGTFIPKEKLKKERLALEGQFGDRYKMFLSDVLTGWDPYINTLEDFLKGYLIREGKTSEDIIPGADFPVLLNSLFWADRYLRNIHREKILLALSKETSLKLTIMGEGWEESALSQNTEILPPGFYAEGVEVANRYKCLLDINPFFLSGLHDRSANALANESVLISNAPEKVNPGLKDRSELIYYKKDDPLKVLEVLDSLNNDEMEAIAKRGHKFYRENLSWEGHVKTLEKIIETKKKQ